MSNTRR